MTSMTLKIAAALTGAVGALALSSAAHATVVWTDWSSNTTGSIGAIGVTYTGELGGLINPAPGTSFAGYIPASSFIGGPVDVVPTAADGALKLVGGGGEGATVDTITFSTALINPVFLIWSLGQNGDPTTFNFSGAPSLSVVAGGPTQQYGGTSITSLGSNVAGIEGNGVVQFHGAVTSISWTNPIHEDYFAFTVGNAVPEPAAWALMLVGFGGLGAMLRRRRAALAA
jgi:hypothetical protein